jgi:RNA polymerase sigma-70 factor (ECF subfamily)
MEHAQDQTLKKALNGDINAFQLLFSDFQQLLKSYLYRLVANRNDAEDLTHDTFIRAFDHLHTFKGQSSLKTWVFQVATNLAYNHLKKRRRWTEDVSAQAKDLVLSNESLRNSLVQVHAHSPHARYDMKEHIDTCFTCISKNLPVENQVAVILKDVYDFSVQEICQILNLTEGVAKYLLQSGRQTMTDIFDRRCALVNKEGVCHQCSELNGWFNPKQNQQEALMQLELVKGSKKYNREELYQLRTQLVKAIDPLRSEGAELQELLLRCNRLAMGEERLE